MLHLWLCSPAVNLEHAILFPRAPDRASAMIPTSCGLELLRLSLPVGNDGCSPAEQPVFSAQVRTDRLRDVANTHSVCRPGRPPAYIPATLPRRCRQQLQPAQITMIQHPSLIDQIPGALDRLTEFSSPIPVSVTSRKKTHAR